jgi:hypothetical protein
MIGLIAVVALLIAAAIAMFWPLRTTHAVRVRDDDRAAYEIARDAKLGELHDLELDFRLGKLSAADYGELNAAVRAEAIEVIRRIDGSARNGKPATTRRRRR